MASAADWRASLNHYAAAFSFSRHNSVSGSVHWVKPQSKQTTSLGNAITEGLSRFFRPEKWMFISAPNSVWFCDPHDLHAIIRFAP